MPRRVLMMANPALQLLRRMLERRFGVYLSALAQRSGVQCETRGRLAKPSIVCGERGRRAGVCRRGRAVRCGPIVREPRTSTRAECAEAKGRGAWRGGPRPPPPGPRRCNDPAHRRVSESAG